MQTVEWYIRKLENVERSARSAFAQHLGEHEDSPVEAMRSDRLASLACKIEITSLAVERLRGYHEGAMTTESYSDEVLLRLLWRTLDDHFREVEKETVPVLPRHMAWNLYMKSERMRQILLIQREVDDLIRRS